MMIRGNTPSRKPHLFHSAKRRAGRRNLLTRIAAATYNRGATGKRVRPPATSRDLHMHITWTGRAALVAAVLSFCFGSVKAQDKKRTGSTDGGDPQRTSWQRNETLITPADASRT